MERQRIVVGIDGSDNARSALQWAYAEASLRKAILQPVMVWSYPYYVMPPDAMVLSEAFESVEQRERDRFEHIVRTGVGAGDPDVTVEPLLVEGQTARELLTRAKGADLLVLGARGRGGFASLLLGSVSQQCVHHPPCPVVIVPAPLA